MVATPAGAERDLAPGSTRWGQLIFGIICMVMIANLQYGWTFFVNPIADTSAGRKRRSNGHSSFSSCSRRGSFRLKAGLSIASVRKAS